MAADEEIGGVVATVVLVLCINYRTSGSRLSDWYLSQALNSHKGIKPGRKTNNQTTTKHLGNFSFTGAQKNTS